MNYSELARRMMVLAIKDAGCSTTEFITNTPQLSKEYCERLKERVLAGEDK